MISGYQNKLASLIRLGILLAICACFTLKSEANPQYRVTILVDESYPPYTYLSNGELKGIYVDLVKQAAQLIDDKYLVELHPVPWKRGVSALQDGEAFALMPPYKHIKRRPFIWPYSVPLLEEVVVAFCNQGFSLKKIDSEDTTAHPINVGLNAGYMILDDGLRQAYQQSKIRLWENKDTFSNVMKLAKNRIDCYVNDRLSTLLGLRNLKRIHPELDLSQIKEDRVVLKRTAHIGYVKDALDRYPYKHDFIEKMDEALQAVLANQAIELGEQ
ncbi:substrate-binding periplasmic protein [Pseudoalteromonas byunsanensis]|uniref:Amino acid ABC transporter substrate-binding protein n=1 Tax=Pseudoalteromonas byunsanensis TaxID=327939 RepID=A0A1S1N2C8_9GAMM|nr:transporter substrate-binding domain-containing protein [Pseudoalteromonas byunsanensis]OHU93594.1 amino acid ABC transporter substrate-binding protein [Pseudoalteromonas byunsanensis]